MLSCRNSSAGDRLTLSYLEVARDLIAQRFRSLQEREIIFGWRCEQINFNRTTKFCFFLDPRREYAFGVDVTNEEACDMRDLSLWCDTVCEQLSYNSQNLRAEHPELFTEQEVASWRRDGRRCIIIGDRPFHYNPVGARSFPDAEIRAEKLFAQFTSARAFRALQEGAGIELIGSQGGKYHLFARRAYCVERIPDGTKMCAVVPGVPLYDHLLGIKLTIETDEPRFLKTANIASAYPQHFNCQSILDADRIALHDSMFGR